MPDPDPLPRALLAYENPEFLDSPDGRMLRILAEYAEPLARFRRENIQDTVVFFGSARFSSAFAETPRETVPEMARYYEEARRLAFLLTQWSQTLGSAAIVLSSPPAAAPASWRRPIAAPTRPAARPSA